MAPSISIIIPVYNDPDLIRRAVASLQAQTFTDWEACIVDECSTDKTASVLQELATQDTRLNVIRQDNGGVSAARNTGIENARGIYLCFLDSDDTYAPLYLEKMLSAIT